MDRVVVAWTTKLLSGVMTLCGFIRGLVTLVNGSFASHTLLSISEQSSKIEAGVENDESVHPFFLHCGANPHGKRVATLKPAFVDARGKEQHKKPIKAINSDST